MPEIYTVRTLSRAVKTLLEGSFPFVWVRGQVSNLSRPGSGHIYFSLKDEDACLNAVWFKSRQRSEESFDPLTGEVYEDGPRPPLSATLENGQEVLVAGALTVYEARGTYQLVVEIIQDVGIGRLHQEFEALKCVLAVKGYFALERKRPIPTNPSRVAVVTALTGAAIRDFLRLARERGTGCELRIFPSLVQGAGAPEDIVRAMSNAVSDNWAEVVVLIRGGGSLEDLWAFNDERVARAVFESPVPVVCGVGHEIDVSIADLTADLRAATPSHAAQLLWPERRVLARRVKDLFESLTMAWERYLERVENRFENKRRALLWLSPERVLLRTDERFADATARLVQTVESFLFRRETQFAALEQDLSRAGQIAPERAEKTLSLLDARLNGLDPLRPLERGYALVRLPNGRFARKICDARVGEDVDILVRDGVFTARILHTKKEDMIDE